MRRGWDQPLAFNIGAACSGARSSGSAMIRWNSGWPRTIASVQGPATNGSRVLGPRNAGRWSDLLALDLKVSRSLPMLGGEVTAFLEIANVTLRRIPCCAILRPPSRGLAGPNVERGYRQQLVLHLGVTFHWCSAPKQN